MKKLFLVSILVVALLKIFCGGAHCAALMKLGAWMRPDGRMRNPTERSRESLHLRRASFGPSEGLMLAH